MKARFINNQLHVNTELYKAILSDYESESYRGCKIAIKTNNTHASRMIAEKIQREDEVWHKLVPITSQHNERPSLQMEAYWTLCKDYDIQYEGHIPQFYYQWFNNRGLIKEEINEATDVMIGDAYKNGDRIEIIIRRFRGEKWDTIEWDTKHNEITAAGTSPEHLITGKKIKLPNSLKKKILVTAKKEMKNPNHFLDDVGGYDFIKDALRESGVPKLAKLIP